MAGRSEVPTTIRTCEQSIGVCYGIHGKTFPTASAVVSLYQSNHIGAMRLYEPSCDMLNALKDTGIKVMMGVPKGMLKTLATPNSTVAVKWVRDNITPYADQVSFKYIVVGNEIAQGDAKYILPALKNMWQAICDAGFQGKIKVSTAVKYDVFANTDYPSKAIFDPSYNMGPIVEFLAETENPFLVNIYPYFDYTRNKNNITIDYAYFKSPSPVVDDNPFYKYQNLFDAMVDAVYYALEKAGGPQVGVVVSESGWPTAGGFAANVENAQTYNNNLIEHVKIGTPKKPEYLETYICSIYDEDKKDGPLVDKHFGLFNTDGSPKYPISFE